MPAAASGSWLPPAWSAIAEPARGADGRRQSGAACGQAAEGKKSACQRPPRWPRRASAPGRKRPSTGPPCGPRAGGWRPLAAPSPSRHGGPTAEGGRGRLRARRLRRESRLAIAHPEGRSALRLAGSSERQLAAAGRSATHRADAGGPTGGSRSGVAATARTRQRRASTGRPAARAQPSGAGGVKRHTEQLQRLTAGRKWSSTGRPGARAQTTAGLRSAMKAPGEAAAAGCSCGDP